VVEARYDENAVARRSVAVASFSNRTGRPDLSWLEGMLPDVFETELANSKYLEPTAAGGHAAIDPDKIDMAKVKAIKADIVVIGKVEKAGGQSLRLISKAIRTSDGAILAAAQLFGNESAAAELGKELVWKLDPPLYQKILGKTSLEGYVSPLAKKQPAEATARQAQAQSDGPRVRIDEVKLSDLFPARLGYYAQRPLGKVILRNDGNRAADDVRLEISLGDLSGGPQTLRVGTIAPGKTIEVPLKLVLDRKSLLEVTQRRPARADMAVLQGDKRETFTEPIVLWDRNAIDWNESESVAAFVTPKDAVVNAFAQDAARLGSTLPPTVPQAVRVAAALFDSVIALGTRYSRDPLSPYGDRAVDTVQFPRETLARKVGDCDDLAVLFASLVQSVGQDAKLVLTPGHIFVAIDAEVSAEHADRLGGASKIVNIDGHSWIPVEITKLDTGFQGAWTAGLSEVGRYKDNTSKITYVDVPRAWNTYPPFPMDAPGSPPDLQTEKTKRLLLADASTMGGGKAAAEEIPLSASATPEDRLDRAIARAKRADYENARKELGELADGPATPRPVRAAAANNLGNIDTLLAKYDEATKDYERALSAGGSSGSIEHNLGVAHYLAGRGDQAKKHLQKSGTSESKKLLVKLGLVAQAETRKKPVPVGGTTPPGESDDGREGLRGAPGEQRLDPANHLIWMK
jgi:transglutaminase-like putative cysteine protease